MELKDILKILNKRRAEIGLFVLCGSFLGLAASFLPGKFKTELSYFVGRAADKPSTEFFTYEGFYAQQTAQSFTNTAVALLESQNLKRSVLGELELPVTDNNIRKLTKSYRVTKNGPQVITLTVADYDYDKSLNTFTAISEKFLEAGEKVSSGSDENISVTPLSDEPVVRQEQRPFIYFVTGGLLFGLALSLLKLAFKEYIK
jgi:capsular polysaccharide biosynthesis protein